MKRYLVALDQGTTGSTALLLGVDGKPLAHVNVEFPQHYPKPGWVEHDAQDWWRTTLEALEQAQAKADVQPEGCVGVGITNQRETTVIWDRKSGEPMGRAIVWQDRRTSADCAELKRRGLEHLLRSRTGLVVDPYFSGTKVAWMLKNHPELRPRAERGELAFGTVESFLVWKLSGGARHVSDISNASRTMFMDIQQRRWDDELCEALEVPKALLPEIVPSSGEVASTKGVPGLPDGTPIAGLAGDQNAALFGQCCFNSGDAKCTYGTGAFLLVNVGERPKPSGHGLLSTVAWQTGTEVRYALEGSAFIAGAAVQWLRDGLGLLAESGESEAIAASVPSSDGVFFVPALAGLGAPHWQPDARGALLGLTRGSTRAHVVRAVLEGIALQIADLADAMAADYGAAFETMRVDGGAAANDLLMQMQSDFLGQKVERPEMVETTALGAAYLAGLGLGVWSDASELRALNPAGKTFEPKLEDHARKAFRKVWAQAVRRTAPLG